jgi:hypothetical protein
MLKWFLIDGDYFTGALKRLSEWFLDLTGLYKSTGKTIGYTLTFMIILILLIYIFVTMTIDEILMIIPNILIYILYLVYSIIIYLLKLLIYILITFKPVNIMAICFFIYLLYVYYYILYSFDYEKILNSFNGKVDETIGKEHANGDYSIVHTYHNSKGCQIIWDRVELVKYWYLLGRYSDAYYTLVPNTE